MFWMKDTHAMNGKYSPITGCISQSLPRKLKYPQKLLPFTHVGNVVFSRRSVHVCFNVICVCVCGIYASKWRKNNQASSLFFVLKMHKENEIKGENIRQKLRTDFKTGISLSFASCTRFSVAFVFSSIISTLSSSS